MIDCVTQQHGAGGGVTSRFITEEILGRFDNDSLRPLEDGSHIDVDATRLVVTMDTHAVDPPIFPGGDIGSLTVSGTVNDLVASGARPLYLTLGLTMSEGIPLCTVRTVLDSVARVARHVGVQIVAGDTKVLDRSARALLLHATGIGVPVVRGRDFALRNARSGDAIVVTGTIGDHELAVLSQREGLGFEQRVESDASPLHDLILPLLPKFEGIRCLRDPTRGGVTAAMCDLAESAGAAVMVDRASVPVTTEVRAACEMLGLDYLDMVNEGKMLIVVDDAEAEVLVDRLRSHHLGRDSAIIGRVVEADTSGRVVLSEGDAHRVITRPEGSAIPRLC